MFSLDPIAGLIRLLALLPALVFHEFCHAYSAYRMGDPTPKIEGRVTLNPLAHLDPFGTLMILFGPIGWAKPVRINPYNFRDAARGLFISTACGPLSNLAQGTVVGLIVRGLLATGNPRLLNGMLFSYLWVLTLINFALAFFNLIPLGPLDGHEVLPYFLPYEYKVKYHWFNRQYGMAVLMGLIFASLFLNLPLLGYVLWPAYWLRGLVTGIR